MSHRAAAKSRARFGIFARHLCVILPEPSVSGPPRCDRAVVSLKINDRLQRLKPIHVFFCLRTQQRLHRLVQCPVTPFNLNAPLALPAPFWTPACLKCQRRVLDRGQLAERRSRKRKSCKFGRSHLLFEVKSAYFVYEKMEAGGEFSGWSVGIQKDYLCNTLRAG